MGLITTSKLDITALKSAQKTDVKSSMASELNVTPRGKFWVASHDGVKVLTAPFLSEGITNSAAMLICADTEEECNAEIKRLGLDTKAVDALNVGK